MLRSLNIHLESTFGQVLERSWFSSCEVHRQILIDPSIYKHILARKRRAQLSEGLISSLVDFFFCDEISQLQIESLSLYTLTPQLQGELPILPSSSGGSRLPVPVVAGLKPHEEFISPSQSMGNGMCTQPSAALRGLGCVSSILWELTFLLLIPRRKQLKLLAICSCNTACQLACHIMPAWKQVCSPALY